MTTAFKGTPGPWRAIPQAYYDGRTDASGVLWWLMKPGGSPLQLDSRVNPNAEADAHVLAAATLLLAACEKAMLACQDNLKMWAYKNEPLLMEAFNECKAALAAATPQRTEP